PSPIPHSRASWNPARPDQRCPMRIAAASFTHFVGKQDKPLLRSVRTECQLGTREMGVIAQDGSHCHKEAAVPANLRNGNNSPEAGTLAKKRHTHRPTLIARLDVDRRFRYWQNPSFFHIP